MKEQVTQDAWSVLATWVYTTIHPAQIPQQTTPEVYREGLDYCDAECLRIRQAWNEKASGLETEKQLQTYLHRQLHYLVALMDQVCDYLLTTAAQIRKRNKALRFFYEQLSPKLEQLLRYLLWYFPSVWEIRHALPQSWMPAIEEECSGYHVAVQVALAADEPEGLAAVALEPILRMLRPAMEMPTFPELQYVRAWAPALLRWAEESKEEEALHRLLRQWNANSEAYYLYCTAAMARELQQQPTTLAQLDTLALWQKELQQLPVHPGKIQVVDRPSVKTGLLHWMEEECHYLEEKNKRYVPIHKRGLETDGYQPRLGMSIPVMGGLLRLMREARLLPNANQSQMLRFFASHFRTSTREVISYHHLRLSYYELEQRSRQQLMEMLYLLLKVLRKMP